MMIMMVMIMMITLITRRPLQELQTKQQQQQHQGLQQPPVHDYNHYWHHHLNPHHLHCQLSSLFNLISSDIAGSSCLGFHCLRCSCSCLSWRMVIINLILMIVMMIAMIMNHNDHKIMLIIRLACFSCFSKRLSRPLPKLLPRILKAFQRRMQSVNHCSVTWFSSTIPVHLTISLTQTACFGSAHRSLSKQSVLSTIRWCPLLHDCFQAKSQTSHPGSWIH